MFEPIFQRFADQSPATVLVCGVLERVLSPAKLDALFEHTADQQYTRALLFSTVFDLMTQVVCGIQPSMHAAYQAQMEELSVSLTSVYNKLNGLELSTSAALVAYSAESLRPLINHLDGAQPPLLPGYRLKIVDGHCLDATEHRLDPLRLLAAGALPGKSLVVYDPSLQMAIHTQCCADGHAQERSLLAPLLDQVEVGDAWMVDRNFCTRAFLCGIEARSTFFIIRHHQQLPWEEASLRIEEGRIDTGTVYEQRVRVTDEKGDTHLWRRIRLVLDQPTRDGATEIALLTNVPKRSASARQIAQLYRRRWTIEQAFQDLATHLNAEINTLGYPPAALFAFCLALVAYNVFAVVKATLCAVHGAEKIEQEFSGYYLANEIANTARGLRIAIAPEQWAIFRQESTEKVADLLRQIAGNIRLRQFKKHPRGPKKKPPAKIQDKKKPHVSTARLLAKTKNEN